MKNDLISRQAAIKAIVGVFPVDPMRSEFAQGISCGAALAKTYVEQMPSAQPEIAPKTGRWIANDDYDGEVYYTCSRCNEPWVTIDGTPQENRMRYCPHCGARMEGETE